MTKFINSSVFLLSRSFLRIDLAFANLSNLTPTNKRTRSQYKQSLLSYFLHKCPAINDQVYWLTDFFSPRIHSHNRYIYVNCPFSNDHWTFPLRSSLFESILYEQVHSEMKTNFITIYTPSHRCSLCWQPSTLATRNIYCNKFRKNKVEKKQKHFTTFFRLRSGSRIDELNVAARKDQLSEGSFSHPLRPTSLRSTQNLLRTNFLTQDLEHVWSTYACVVTLAFTQQSVTWSSCERSTDTRA